VTPPSVSPRETSTWRYRRRRLLCLWPLALDGLLLGVVARGFDLPIAFDAPALAGWSALVVGIGFLSGWIAHRAISRCAGKEAAVGRYGARS